MFHIAGLSSRRVTAWAVGSLFTQQTAAQDGGDWTSEENTFFP